MYYVYKITNSINNKSYIGYTGKDPQKRFVEHLKTKTTYKKCSTKWYRAINKYKSTVFTISILYQSKLKSEALLKEKEFISTFDTIKNGYNTHEGGFGGNTGAYHKVGKKGLENPMFGKKLSIEHKTNLHNAAKNYRENLSTEQKEKIKSNMSLKYKGVKKSKSSIEKALATKSFNKDKIKHRFAIYEIVTPDNKKYIINGKQNLKQFCIDNDLSLWTVERVLLQQKQPKFGNCLGWRAKLITYISKSLPEHRKLNSVLLLD